MSDRIVLKRVPMGEVPKGSRVFWHAYTTSSDWHKQLWNRDAEVYVQVSDDE